MAGQFWAIACCTVFLSGVIYELNTLNSPEAILRRHFPYWLFFIVMAISVNCFLVYESLT